MALEESDVEHIGLISDFEPSSKQKEVTLDDQKIPFDPTVDPTESVNHCTC